jgi:hypothetical protein
MAKSGGEKRDRNYEKQRANINWYDPVLLNAMQEYFTVDEITKLRRQIKSKHKHGGISEQGGIMELEDSKLKAELKDRLVKENAKGKRKRLIDTEKKINTKVKEMSQKIYDEAGDFGKAVFDGASICIPAALTLTYRCTRCNRYWTSTTRDSEPVKYCEFCGKKKVEFIRSDE